MSVSDIVVGKLRAAYAVPAGTGPYAGVLVLHESFGLTDDMRDMIGVFAEHGYAALIPDLYSWGVRPLCMAAATAWAAASHWPPRPATTSPSPVAGANHGAVPQQAPDLAGICPVVTSYGGRDRVFGPQPDRLERHLRELGAPDDIKVYPGVGHSCFNTRPQPRSVLLSQPLLHCGYDQTVAEDAWRRIFAFFDQRLAPATDSGSVAESTGG